MLRWIRHTPRPANRRVDVGVAFPLSTLVIALVALATPARAQAPAPPPDTIDSPATATGVLRPGDVVRLNIWREPDLSGDYSVDATGVVVFPKIGPRQVAGESFQVLEKRLIEEYRRYLRNPAIEVVALRRITILGEVAKPGLYPVDLTMTVADALALAGGINAEGSPDDIKLIRDGREQRVNLSQSTLLSALPVRSGDQIYVDRRSWLSRNSWGAFATAMSLMVSLFLR